MQAAPGRLYGLGVGPGDPELLTLKALRLLRQVPVIAYPAPEHGESFARSIVADWIAGHQREIAIRFPMRPGPPPVSPPNSTAAKMSLSCARATRCSTAARSIYSAVSPGNIRSRLFRVSHL